MTDKVMEPFMQFKTVLHADRDFVKIPRRFFRRWRHELHHEVHIQGEDGGVFTCKLEPQGDSARLTNGFDEIKLFYDIEETVLIKFYYLRNSHFAIFIAYDADEFESDEEDPHEELLWRSTITQSMKNLTKTLKIPEHVVHYILPHRPEEIIVLLPDQSLEIWTLHWNVLTSNDYRLGHGWYDFIGFFDIHQHDTIKFMTIIGTDIIRVAVNED
ncbi:hypothetical protein E2542_SST08250 [Spatholobus suberectus]|nr:hypothetical protein E2542_SST08250 [Spatholobus suberectus]